MAEGEGEELPPVVAALVGDDASFLEMIARDVELAGQFKADMEAALSGAGTVSEPEGGTEAGAGAGAGAAESAEAGAEAYSEMAASAEESLAQVEAASESFFAEFEAGARASTEAVAAAAIEGGQAYSEGMLAGVRPLPEQITELLRQGLDEQAQALMDQLPSVVEGPATAAGAQIGQALTAGTAEGIVQGSAAATAAADDFIDDVVERYKAGALSATQAIAAIAGEEVQATTALSGPIARLRGTWQAAAAAADDAGISEAQLALTSGVLTDAQSKLSDANAMLMLAFTSLADGTTVSLDSMQGALTQVAEAQARVTEMTQAQVAAMTELNLAAIQNDSAMLSDANAMAGYAAVATALDMDISQVSAAIEEGNTALLAAAASQAQATIQADLLAGAQQRLAAAQMTLIQMDQQMAAGTEISTEAQAAALAGVRSAQSDVSGLAGGMGKVSGATKEAESAFGGLSSIMYGPLGMAIYPLMSVLPMLGGMFSSNAVSASVFTSAITQDSGAVGDNTAATIQSTLAKSNLSDISSQLGLSQAQLIEYAAGEANVQNQVTAAYNAKETALQNVKGSTQQVGEVTKDSAEAGTNQANELHNQKAALDQVTTAVQQAIVQDQAQSDALLAAEQSTQIYDASVNALGSSMLLQTQQTKMSNQATVEYGARLLAAQSTTSYMAAAVGAAGINMELTAHATEITNLATVAYGAAVLDAESSAAYMAAAVGAAGMSMQLQQHATEITNLATVAYGDTVMGAYRDVTMFNAAVDASYVSMQEQAQTASMASVGLLNLGDSQSDVNRTLVYSEESYSQAQQGANAYSSALTALNGSTNTLLGDEASFTTALAGLTTAVDTNGKSLDVNTAKGAANVTAVTQIATSAQAAAVAVYQNEVSQVGATKAYQDATTKLEQQKTAFEQAADKAGFNKTQVQQLANELYQIPTSITSTVNVNDASALSTLSTLEQIQQVAQNMPGSTSGHVVGPGHADGGPVMAGVTYPVGERGTEMFTPTQNGYITPHEALGGGGSSGGGGGGGGGYGSSSMPPVYVTVLVDGHEIAAVVTPAVRAEAQQTKTRNSITGFN